MLKVLWMCNIILPDFSEEFHVKKNSAGGWMTGMLHTLQYCTGVEISLCFPIIDESRMKDGECNGYRYYSFFRGNPGKPYTYCTNRMTDDLERIVKTEKPDVIHIWGSEYPHTYAMVRVCEKLKILDRIVINIQGLVSICQKHYFADLSEQVTRLKLEGGCSIEEDRQTFEKNAAFEINSIKKIENVMGRTEWDKACIYAINPQCRYWFCNEILRDEFYNNAEKWSFEKCEKHSIFISQASYPIKGFHYLLEALPIIKGCYVDVMVYVAGSNVIDNDKSAYGLYIKQKIIEYGLQSQIVFLGSLAESEMISWYLRTNVFLSASSIENSSNSICEAMLLGVPVVSSFVGGIGSLIRHGENGYLYPVNDTALLAYYVMDLFRDERKCYFFSKMGSDKMRKFVSKEDAVGRTLECYRSLAQNPVKKRKND